MLLFITYYKILIQKQMERYGIDNTMIEMIIKCL